MALGRYARVDGQNSPNHCLVICIVGFVSTCLMAAWMTMSSSSGAVRTGISVEQFMGGMPKIVKGNDKSEESGEYQDKIPAAEEEIGAVKMKDGVVDQSNKSGQEMNESSPTPQVMPRPTQSAESEKEKLSGGFSMWKDRKDYRWKVCNVTAGPDYIPCLDNIQAIKMLRTTRHYEHRERHCPDEAPTCLVPLPKGYRTPVKWPKSRDMVH